MSENKGNLKNQVFSGVFWKFIERISAKLMGFIISLVLARILSPSDYGTISIIMVFIQLAEVIVYSGFGNSLVQKSEADDIDFSSTFYFSTILMTIIYVVLFFCSPLIANFYDNDLISSLLRVMGIRLLFSGLSSIQSAYIDRNMLFQKYVPATIISVIISGVVAFYMAFNGYGVWSLVAQYLIQSLISTIVLFFTLKWRPIMAFSFERLKSIISYGWKLLLSSLIVNMYNELRSLIIGKMYSSEDLGYYSKGRSFPQLINDNLTTTINSVLFSAMSKEQSNVQKVKEMTRRSVKTTAFIVIPIMTGLAVVANPLIRFLLTDKWIESVPYLQIACFVSALTPIHSANLQAIKALGRSDVILKLDIIKRAIGIFILILVMRYGVIAIALSGAFNSLMFTFVNAAPNKELLGYRISEQVKDVAPYVIMSAIMGLVVYPIQLIAIPDIIILVIQGALGFLVYFGLSLLTKQESLHYIVNILKQNFSKLKKRKEKS